MESELMFSGPLLTALTVLFAVCLLLPTMYYVWFVYRKRLNHVAILGGLAAFFLFGYLIGEMLLRLVAPAARIGQMGMWSYGLLRALCVSVSEMGGFALALWFLQRQQGTIRVPIGFALGYRLFEMFYLGALNTFIRLSYAMTVNKEGLASVLGQVAEDQAPALELQLVNLAESAPGLYWMSTVDYVCRFVLTVALARLMWYAFEGGREPADKRLIAVALGLDFLCELMLALHAAGASYHLCAAIYYVLVAGTVCLAYTVARRRDDPQQLSAEHLKSRVRRKRY